MRRLALLPLLLAACTDAPTASGPAPDPEAVHLLEGVGREAMADAFDALATTPYTASVRVTVLDAAGDTLGTEAATLRGEGDRVRTTDRVVTGALEGDEAPLRLRDPLTATIPEDPPYLDPAARDAYRLAVVGDTTLDGRRLRLVEATLTDDDLTHAVRRVRAAVDPASGQAVMVEVTRAADSVIYDETSTVRVDLSRSGDIWLPRHIVTDSRTDVPFTEGRRVRTVWAVTEAGGRRLPQ